MRRTLAGASVPSPRGRRRCRFGGNLSEQRRGNESCSTDPHGRPMRGHSQRPVRTCSTSRVSGVATRRRDGSRAPALGLGQNLRNGQGWSTRSLMDLADGTPEVVAHRAAPRPRPGLGPFTHTPPPPTWPRSLFPPRAALAKKSNPLLGGPATVPRPLTSVRALGSS